MSSSIDRKRALQEAQQVLESLDSRSDLDGFNLLGVVANPRGHVHHERTSSRGGSGHGGNRGSLHGGNTSTSSETTAALSFTDSTMHAFESSLAQMSEQIDVMTHVLDSWSRQYLGSYDETTDLEYTPPVLELPTSSQETAAAAAAVNLDAVQTYLQTSGTMAHTFSLQNDSSIQQQDEQDDASFNSNDNGMQEVEETICPIFFQSYFDLTDPSTFCELLVLNDEDDDLSNQQQQQQQHHLSDEEEALSVPTWSILRLPPPEHLTPALDKVEVALLNQVRCKSLQFFHETNRFGLLKEWIAGLVQETQRLRQLLNQLQLKSVLAWELIPQLDTRRQELQRLVTVLEQASQVVRSKSSIGGLLAAGQNLDAALQIQYGRDLLKEQPKLQALASVGDQLSQYERLVVANLSEQLVEILLDWNGNHHENVSELHKGLSLCGALEATEQLYGNRLNDVIRMTVRTTVGEFAEDVNATVKAGVTSMTLERFMDCLDMLFEQVLQLMRAAVGVQDYLKAENISFQSSETVVSSAAELSCKSISELLRLRKEAHSLVTLQEMKYLWDVCMSFITQFENLTDYKATALRSTLLAQAKAFVERKHESNMSALVAALDSERWTQCDVSAERQDALTRLCLGRSVMYASSKRRLGSDEESKKEEPTTAKKMSDAEVEGVRYKVVWSCLLLVEMVMTDVACSAHYKTLATNLVGKVAELLRLFNSRATQLVLGAGAIHSAARLKSINAKHLSLVTQCVGMIIAILPHVRAALMAQLPAKQHTLLNDLDTIRNEYEEHNEKILNKFVTIIGGIVEHGLAPRIGNTDFDQRARDQSPDVPISCCVFLEGVATNTRKMHQVLSSLLPPDHLQDSFSRIFAYLDQKLPELFIAAAAGNPPSKPPTFSFPSTDEGKKHMLLEMEMTTKNLNELAGVRPWDFSAMGVLEQELDYKLQPRIDESSMSQDDPAIVRANTSDADGQGQSSAPENDLPTQQLAEAVPDGNATSESSVRGGDVVTERILEAVPDAGGDSETEQSVATGRAENGSAPAVDSSAPPPTRHGENSETENGIPDKSDAGDLPKPRSNGSASESPPSLVEDVSKPEHDDPKDSGEQNEEVLKNPLSENHVEGMNGGIS